MTAPQHPRNTGPGGQYATGQYQPAPYSGSAVPPGPVGAPGGSHAAAPPVSGTATTPHPAGSYEDVGGVSVGGRPDWVTFTPDSKRVYIATENTNSVSVVDAPTMKEVTRVKVGPSPKRNITALLP